MFRTFTSILSTIFIISSPFVISAMPIEDNDDIHILPMPPVDFDGPYEDRTDELPTIAIPADNSDATWEFIPNVAQYKLGDWSTCIGVAHNTSREAAKAYAEANKDVSFFFYVKGYQLVLENNSVQIPYFRVFTQGDAVFFGGDASKAHWGEAKGLADGYVKKQ